MFSEEAARAMRKLAEEAKAQFPSVGKHVTVAEGKHAGKSGIVFWHGEDKYNGSWRHASDAQLVLRQINGRYGYRVGVKTETGEKFFVRADHVEVK